MQRTHQRPGYGFAISDDRGDKQVRIVKSRTKGVRHAITQFATLMNRPGRFRSAVAANAAGKGKLLEELEQSFGILGLIRVDLGVSSFEIRVRQSGGSAVSRAGDVNHIQIVFLDEPVQVDPDEALTGIGSPMPYKTLLDVFDL